MQARDYVCMAHDAARVLIHKQGPDSPGRLKALSDKNVDNTCNVLSANGFLTEGTRYQLWLRRT